MKIVSGFLCSLALLGVVGCSGSQIEASRAYRASINDVLVGIDQEAAKQKIVVTGQNASSGIVYMRLPPVPGTDSKSAGDLTLKVSAIAPSVTELLLICTTPGKPTQASTQSLISFVAGLDSRWAEVDAPNRASADHPAVLPLGDMERAEITRAVRRFFDDIRANDITAIKTDMASRMGRSDVADRVARGIVIHRSLATAAMTRFAVQTGPLVEDSFSDPLLAHWTSRLTDAEVVVLNRTATCTIKAEVTASAQFAADTVISLRKSGSQWKVDLDALLGTNDLSQDMRSDRTEPSDFLLTSDAMEQVLKAIEDGSVSNSQQAENLLHDRVMRLKHVRSRGGIPLME